MSNSVGPHRLYNPWNSPGQNTGEGSLYLFQGIFLTQGWNLGLLHCRQILYHLSQYESEAAQSCPTLCDPTDCSLPGSSVHGIFQARVLEWGAIAFSIPWVPTNLLSPSVDLPTWIFYMYKQNHPTYRNLCLPFIS